MCMREEDMAKFSKSELSQSVIKAIHNCIERDASELKYSFDAQILYTIARMVSSKRMLCDQLIMNEAETRYALCDPMFSLVCQCFDFSLKLEETIRDNLIESSEDGKAKVWKMEDVSTKTSAASKRGRRSIGSAISPKKAK